MPQGGLSVLYNGCPPQQQAGHTRQPNFALQGVPTRLEPAIEALRWARGLEAAASSIYLYLSIFRLVAEATAVRRQTSNPPLDPTSASRRPPRLQNGVDAPCKRPSQTPTMLSLNDFLKFK